MIYTDIWYLRLKSVYLWRKILLKSVIFEYKNHLKSVKLQHSCRHCHIQRTPDIPRRQNYLYASIFCHVHGGWCTTSWRSSISLLITKTSLPLLSRGDGRHNNIQITLKLYLSEFIILILSIRRLYATICPAIPIIWQFASSKASSPNLFNMQQAKEKITTHHNTLFRR